MNLISGKFNKLIKISSVLILIGFFQNILAQESFTPNIKPSLSVPRISGEIKIDGDLNDSGWVGAAVAMNFTENFPDNKTEPPVKTEVRLTYNDKYLYVAFIASDKPEEVRSNLHDRDDIWNDDYIGIILDTWGDASTAYELFVNPTGIQGDGLQNLQGEDISFDIVYESKGKVVDNGYQVELAIPFSSLRFPEKPEQEWKATFWRTHPRESRSTYTWAYIDDNNPCWICEFGTLTGIRNVKPGGSVEILPSIVGSQSAELRDGGNPDSGLKYNKIGNSIGVGVRYFLSSSMTAEAAYNPDFSQVESDPAQIDVNTTFALFFPEKRPFFQEGSGLFDTWHKVFYTRSINDPLGAIRLTGRIKKTDIAVLTAYDRHSPLILPFQEQSEVIPSIGKSFSNIIRVRQNILENSYVGLIGVTRAREKGGSGTSFGTDGFIRFLTNYRFKWQFLGSNTVEPNDTLVTRGLNNILFDSGKHTAAFDGESYMGAASYVGVDRSAKHWNFNLSYVELSPTFRADNGFVTQNDQRMAELYSDYTFYPESKFLKRISPSVEMAREWDYSGKKKDEWIIPNLYLLFTAQTSININYVYTKEIFHQIDFPKMERASFEISSDFSEPLKAGFDITSGSFIARFLDPPVMSKGTVSEAWMTIQPFTMLIIQPEFQYEKFNNKDTNGRLFEGYVLRTKLNIQFSRELLLRTVVQIYRSHIYTEGMDDNSLAFEPLLTYKINPFTIFYIGSGNNFYEFPDKPGLRSTSRQYFAKFQYLFRI